MDGDESKLVNAQELAAIYGVTCATITAWYREGIIPAEMAEGRVYRFDTEKVRLVLRHRAAKRAEGKQNCQRSTGQFYDYLPRPSPPTPKPVERGPLDPPSKPYAFMEMMRAREARERREAKQAREEGKK
jgi:hypothetical protein